MERFKQLVAEKNVATVVKDVPWYRNQIDSIDAEVSSINTRLDELNQQRTVLLNELATVCDHKPRNDNEKLKQLLHCNAATGDERCFFCPQCHLHLHVRKSEIKP